MRNVETAYLSDLSALKSINALLRIDVEDFYWDTAPYIAAAVREGRCFVFRRERDIEGCMIIERRPPDENFNDEHLAIGSLSVHPDFRNGNLGARLVRFAKDMARKENKRLYVESFYEFRKTAFYESHGFKKTAPGVYRGKPYHVMYVDPDDAG